MVTPKEKEKEKGIEDPIIMTDVNTMEYVKQIADSTEEYSEVSETEIRNEGHVIAFLDGPLSPDLLAELGISGASLTPIAIDGETVAVRIEPAKEAAPP